MEPRQLFPDLERQIVQTENAIRLLLAQPPGDILRGRTLTEQPIPPEIPAGLPAALLERRPDIRASEEIWSRPMLRLVRRRRCTFRASRSRGS